MLKPMLVSLGLLVSAGVHADPQPVPQPLAHSEQPPAKTTVRRLPAPTMSVMRVTRQPDGTLTTDCIQQPNPKARAKAQGVRP